MRCFFSQSALSSVLIYTNAVFINTASCVFYTILYRSDPGIQCASMHRTASLCKYILLFQKTLNRFSSKLTRNLLMLSCLSPKRHVQQVMGVLLLLSSPPQTSNTPQASDMFALLYALYPIHQNQVPDSGTSVCFLSLLVLASLILHTQILWHISPWLRRLVTLKYRHNFPQTYDIVKRDVL